MITPRRTLSLLLLSGTALLLGARTFHRGLWRFNYPSEAEFPVRGIDVSHHQGTIDWTAVGKAGSRFAYIKASEGGDLRDGRFAYNWSEAKRAGLRRGAYHFFTLCRPGAEQAANFIAAVPDDPDALPPAVDFEFVGNCRARPPREQVQRELSAFVDAVRRSYGKEPVLYATSAAYSRYLAGGVGLRLWTRNIFRRPGPVESRPWTFWQFAQNVHVPGIAGGVDQEVFSGTPEDFAKFAARR